MRRRLSSILNVLGGAILLLVLGLRASALDGQFLPEIDVLYKLNVVQTGPNTFDVVGDFTIRGASKPQTLTLTVSGKG